MHQQRKYLFTPVTGFSCYIENCIQSVRTKKNLSKVLLLHHLVKMSLKIKKFQLNSNNLTKNIVREIIRELDDQNVKGIEKSFVEYVVDLMALNNGIDFSKSIINRNVIEEFIEKCNQKICGEVI